MDAKLDLLRAELFDNLQHHVESVEQDSEKVFDIHQCDAEEKALRYKYRQEGMSDMMFEKCLKEVESKIFTSSRHAVDSCLVRLKSRDSEDQYSACTELMSQLFSPFYRRSSYDAADYFSSQGGVEMLVQLVSSTWQTEEHVCTVALIAAQEFMSSDGRTDMMIKCGILPLVVKILNLSSSSTLKSKGAGVLCALLDIRSAQIEAVKQGALDPIINIAMSTENELTDVEAAVACLYCCSSNPKLVEDIINAGTVNLLCDLSVTITERHDFELNHPDCLDIVKKLPRMIKFMCHATNGLLFTQKVKSQWRELIENSTRDVDMYQCLSYLHKEEMWVQALQLAAYWMKIETPESVWEAERDRYVWPVLKSFTVLLSCSHPVVRHLGAFSMAKLSLGPNNCQTLVDEEGKGVDLLQLSSWSVPEKEHNEHCRETSSLCSSAYHRLLPLGLHPPRLESICLYYIGNHFASSFAASVDILPRNLQLNIIPFSNVL